MLLTRRPRACSRDGANRSSRRRCLELVAAIERAAGRRVRILTPDEEARLAFTGAVALSRPAARLVAVVDLGGASTEIAVGRPDHGPDWARSIDLGAARLTSRLLKH